MRPDDISLLVSLCRARAGMNVSPDKTYLIESRLAPVARKENYPTISDLLQAIRANREERLIWAVVEAMAQQETSFFRDRPVFEHFRDVIIPTLGRARGAAPIRVWSAACGAGQEVYSLAMVADQLEGAAPKIEFAASDLSEASLEKAQSGVYSQFEVQRGLPIRLLARYFEKNDDLWRLSPRIRQMVRWRRINLIAGLRGIGPFDVVFCRNVLGGMTPAVQKTVLEEMASVVAPDGYLVLGTREAAEASDAFEPLNGHPGVYTRNPAYRAAAA